MSAEWRRAVRPASKPEHFNVRVISRAHDGTQIVLDLSEVPKEKWIEHFGSDYLATVRSVSRKEAEVEEFVRRAQAAQAAVDEIIEKAKP